MQLKRRLALTLAILLSLTATSRAIDKQRIKKAVDAGVQFLRQSQNLRTGQWNYTDVGQVSKPTWVYGMTSLGGLTLLVCNVPATDPAVQKAAAFVRNGAASMVDTYSISLAIMFLDKLGDRADEDIIQGLAQRLIQGQKADGAWSYDCPSVPFKEARRLKKGDEPPDKKEQGGDKSGPPSLPPGLRPGRHPGTPPNWNDFNNQRPPGGPGGWGQPFGAPAPPVNSMRAEGDNSNTQFAIMALWIAQRHDIKAMDSLTRVSRYFRATQNLDGGWAYLPGRTNNSTPSMTCAGLIGLAVGKGVKGKDANNGKAKYDSRVALALGRLGQQDVGRPVGDRRDARPPIVVADTIGVYYFLWSLERTAMIYSLKTIHKKDWYAWGAELLVFNQKEDGSWRGKYGKVGPADTCFALMFLMRSNLVDDLTRALHGPSGAVERTLRPRGLTGNDESTQDTSDDELSAPGPASTLPSPPKPGTPFGPDRIGSRPVPMPHSTGAGSSRLATLLAGEPLTQQRALLAEYRDGRGGTYTEALAGAIHNLDGDLREQVRDTLAQRLARMTAGTLRGKLQDDDNEIRSAAALACGMKEEQSLIPNLIQALKDKDSRVPQAARIALKHLTREDFGPAPTATRAERAAAAAKWQRWWQQHQRGG